MDERQPTKVGATISIPTLLEVIGFVLVAGAAALWDPRALLALVGVALIVASNLMDNGE